MVAPVAPFPHPPPGRVALARLALAVALVAAVLVAYAPSLNGGWLWDDDAHVTDNPTLRDLGGLRLIWATPGATPQYYPLTHTTWWVEWRLWGERATGYRVVNALLHAASALLVVAACRRLSVGGDGAAGRWAAWVAGAAFALHPVHAESIAWVSERKNVLSGLLYLSALLVYLGPTAGREPPRVGRTAGSATLFVLALLSKTVTALLPAALAVVLWWRWGAGPGEAACGRRRWWVGHAARLGPMLLLGAAMGRVTAGMEAWNVGAVGPEFDHTPAERVLIAGRAVWFYAGKVAVPWPLSFVHERWTIDAADPAQWLWPSAAIAVVLAAAGWAWVRRDRLGRGPLAAVLLFAGTLFPALGFVNVYPHRYSFVADHFQYLASLALIVPAAIGLVRLAGRHGGAGDAVGAMAEYRRALALDPRYEPARLSLARLLLAGGDAEGALAEYAEAVRRFPPTLAARVAWGDALASLGRPGEAAAQYRAVLARRPDAAAVRAKLDALPATPPPDAPASH